MLARLRSHKRLTFAVLAIATVVGVASARINTAGTLDVAAAATNVLVDTPGRSIVDRASPPADIGVLDQRAELYAGLLVSPPVLADVARRAGVPPHELSGVARNVAGLPLSLTQPESELRATQIVDSRAPYRLEMQARPGEPILTIYSQAATPAQAERLANAAVRGLQDSLRTLAHRQGFPQRRLPVLRQLGLARGGVISGHASLVIGVLTFVTAFGLSVAILCGLLALHARRRRPAVAPPGAAPDGDVAASEEPAADDWPHTTRVLPWMVAGFLAVLWLTPFDRIQLAMSTPIDMKLDRLLLPFLVGAWLVAMAAGGRLGPCLRLTPIHLALAAFLACAFLSVVLDARGLNHTLELGLAVKKLPLLVSYMSLFLIVASSVRRSEVRAFMTYSLILAVVCALGIIWEYRFKQNLFDTWAQTLLPPGFSMDAGPAADIVDCFGRRDIVGPAAVGLEAVSMLAMALPIALVGLLGAKRPRERLLYALALCVLVAATFGTVRKSAMVAPTSVLLTLAYFRRRELLSLAPMGLVIAIVATMLSPGAVHGTISQFISPGSENAATTQDRVSDYDAIRPDVWTHLLFGRGFGSYDHNTYRILDSEILGRLVETGVLGLAAFLLIGVSVVFAARSTVAGRVAPYAGLALIGTAAAICFLVVSTLFDVLGFPHVTYIFLYLAGLTAVVVQRPPARPPPAVGGHRDSAAGADARKSPALHGVR